MERPFTCATCHQRQFRFESAIAKVPFEGVVRELVHRFKYQGHFYLRHPLAEWLSMGLKDSRFLNQAADALVPVPLHPLRLREREFNQSEILARLLSRRAALPVLPCLRRIRYTSTQTRLNCSERQENLKGAFEVLPQSRIHGCHLILIDDVFTTGSTVHECTKVLLKAGAGSVRVMTVARG